MRATWSHAPALMTPVGVAKEPEPAGRAVWQEMAVVVAWMWQLAVDCVSTPLASGVIPKSQKRAAVSEREKREAAALSRQT